MPRLRMRIELNRSGRGIPVESLAGFAFTTNQFLATLGQDLGLDLDSGRWVAYQTNASGRFEIVVKSFHGGSVEGGTWQVSREGGVQPRWSRDGREIYFIAPDGSLFASAVSPQGETLNVRTPERLFATRINGGGGMGSNASEYAVSRDGRFLIDEIVEENSMPITVVVNPKF